MEKFLKKEVSVSLTDKDLEDYYSKNRDKFKEPEAVRLGHVYIKINTSEPNI